MTSISSQPSSGSHKPCGIASHTRALCVLSGLAGAALLGACGRSNISERPPAFTGDSAPPIATRPSTVGALVTIPLADAVQAANAALPKTYSQDWTNGEDACADLGPFGKPCVGTRYKYNVQRGDISITAVGTNAVKLSVHVALDGQGGLRGDLPKLLSASAKNFDAAANVEIVLTPSMGADWCPSLAVNPTYTWTKNPRVEIVSRVNVDVAGQVNTALDSKLPQIAQAVEKSIDCAQLKSQLASMYGTRTFPIEVSAGQKMHLNVQPVDFAFSGFNVDPSAIRLAAMLTAKLELSGTPIAPAAVPLPPLKTIGVGAPPRIAIAVPLRAPFELMQAEAQKLLAGKVFRANTPAGEVQATLNKVEIYPTSGDKLAVGVDFDAKLPGKLLDTKGVVYVVGTPVAESGTTIRLKDPSFTRALDNDAWNVLSALFETQIRAQLDKSLRYNFANDIEKAKKALAAKLAEPAATRQVRATVTDVDIALGRVGVNKSDLVAEGIFGANVVLEPNLAAVVAGK